MDGPRGVLISDGGGQGPSSIDLLTKGHESGGPMRSVLWTALIYISQALKASGYLIPAINHEINFHPASWLLSFTYSVMGNWVSQYNVQHRVCG
jgi:hypothetical protein